jgi:phage FluMu protein Com
MISTTPRPSGAVDRRQAVTEPSVERVVPKPVPESQAQDPRKYHIDQLKKRFSAKVSTLQSGITAVSFLLKPSDPDFPFELDALDCEIQVPREYPRESPSLRVKNKDIPRGFGINIEKGWDRLVQEKKGATLLALTNALDKHLEVFLSEQKSETVTFMTFKDTRHLNTSSSALGSGVVSAPTPEPQTAPPPRKLYVPEESFTREQIAAAKARRAQETRQLESRMGRMSLFHKSADGIVYTLPLEPKRRADLPTELQPIKSVQLIIPLLYPLQPLRILLSDVESKDAELLEEAFSQRGMQQNQMTLMSHLNYLTQHMHVLAKASRPAAKPAPTNISSDTNTAESAATGGPVGANTDGKSHVQVIPRPPEWTLINEDGESEEDSEDWNSEDESDEGGAAIESGAFGSFRPAQQIESGTSISFPSIELHGIELLQVSILGIDVKCERCRTINEITGLKPEMEKASSCKKCATPFTIKFRQELVHQNSVRAGFIDVAGCTVADMLPRYVYILYLVILPWHANPHANFLIAHLFPHVDVARRLALA